MLLASYLKSTQLLSMTFIGSLFFGASAYYIFDVIAPVKVLPTINIADVGFNHAPPQVDVSYLNNDRWLLFAFDKVIEVSPVFSLPALRVRREKTQSKIIKKNIMKPQIVTKYAVAKKIKYRSKNPQEFLETKKPIAKKERKERVDHPNKQHRPVVVIKQKKIKRKAYPSPSLEQSLGINLVQ